MLRKVHFTVPGIRFVIDAGTARISRYNPRLKVQRLPVEAGNGRAQTKECDDVGGWVRELALDSHSAKEDYDSRPPFTTPEIQRSNSRSVITEVLYMRLNLSMISSSTVQNPRRLPMVCGHYAN